jgi:DNA-directed RNA polymerase specialized sigma subunit
MKQTKLEPELLEPYKAWKADPSKTNAGAMLRAVDPIIKTAVRSFGGTSAKSGPLRSQAKRLTLDALGSYDPNKGPMKTHLMSRLQRLRRIAARQRQIIRVPEQVALDQMQTEASFAELEEKFGRPPSDIELADYTGLSLKRIAYVRGSQRPIAQSTITRPGAEGTGQFDPRVKPVSEDYSQWTKLVYDDLDETSQFIMERVLGMHGHQPHKPNEIAKLLKVSPAAISHRMARIQLKLDQREELAMI